MNLSFPFVADFSSNFAHAQEQATLSTSKVTAAIWSYGHCSSYSVSVHLYKQGGTSMLMTLLNCTVAFQKAISQEGSQDKIETSHRHQVVAVVLEATLQQEAAY